MLVDSAGLVLALAATYLARRPSDIRRTYGYARVEVLVVPLHVFLMLGLSAYIVFEAIGRLGETQRIEWPPVLLAGVVGLSLNFVVLRLLHGHAHDNLNARSAMFEVTADALGSVGVIVSALAISLFGWTQADVVISLVIAALIVPRALLLLRPVVAILLDFRLLGRIERGMTVEIRYLPAPEVDGDEAAKADADPLNKFRANLEEIADQLLFPEANLSPLVKLPKLPNEELDSVNPKKA